MEDHKKIPTLDMGPRVGILINLFSFLYTLHVTMINSFVIKEEQTVLFDRISYLNTKVYDLK